MMDNILKSEEVMTLKRCVYREAEYLKSKGRMTEDKTNEFRNILEKLDKTYFFRKCEEEV